MGRTVPALRQRLEEPRLERPAAWALLAAVVPWAVISAAAEVGALDLPHAHLFTLAGPLLLIALTVSAPEPAKQYLWPATGAAIVVAAALIGAHALERQPSLAIAVPGMLVSTVVAVRRPAAVTIAIVALTGCFGTLDAYTSISAPQVVDLLLVGLWGGLLWGAFVQRRERPSFLWPGVIATALYLFVTALQITTAESISIGVHSFRVSAWYLMAFLLLAYAGWTGATYERIARGVVVVAALVGAYATVRWLVGPSALERDHAVAVSGPYDYVDGHLRVFGPFSSGHTLAAWTAVAIPFCLAIGLWLRGWWRALAGAACILCAFGLLASEVRVGLAGAGLGVLTVVVLYQLSRGFRGLHLGVAAGLLAGAVAVGGFALYTTSGSSGGSDRYKAILQPKSDPSFNARIFKWRNAVEQIDSHPWGEGLGTAGAVYRGRFQTLGQLQVDNSYLKVAFEQGFVIMGLFIAAVLLLLFGMARRSVIAGTPPSAAAAIGATGTLVALLTIFLTAVYIEGLPALFAWMLVGLGAGRFAAGHLQRRPEPVAFAAPAAPAPAAAPAPVASEPVTAPAAEPEPPAESATVPPPLAHPRVTVIIGTLDSAATLPRAIESILAQTIAELELLVVDDGSTDSTPEVVARYDDPRLRYLKLPHMGIARSLNRGVEEARADIIGIQDADDWSLPERFQKTVELLESRPEVAAVGVQMREVDEYGKELTRRVPRVVGDVKPVIMRFNPAPNNCLTIRKSALEEIGGWDPRWYYNVDYDMLLRLAERYEVVNLGETLGMRTLSVDNYFTGPRHERAQIAEGLQVRMAAMRRRGSLDGVAGLAKPTASLITPQSIKAAIRRRRGQAQ